MTVTNTTNKVTEQGNGSKTDFDFSFKIFSASQLAVYKVNIATGVATGPLILNTDYSVDINSVTEGGTVTYVVAPTAAQNSFIKRVIDYQQIADLEIEGNLPATQLEDQLDRQTMMIIQLKEITDRCIQSDPTSTLTLVLPTPQDGYLLSWDGVGGTITNVPNAAAADVDVDAAIAAAAAAAVSATAAAASATAAAASAASIDTSNVVHRTTDETIAGVKTFTSILVLPASDPTTSNQATRKSYVDGKFNTSTGHDHDGSDSKKVLVSNLDPTGITDGYFLKRNGTAVVGVVAPGSALTLLTPVAVTNVANSGNITLAANKVYEVEVVVRANAATNDDEIFLLFNADTGNNYKCSATGSLGADTGGIRLTKPASSDFITSDNSLVAHFLISTHDSGAAKANAIVRGWVLYNQAVMSDLFAIYKGGAVTSMRIEDRQVADHATARVAQAISIWVWEYSLS